MPRTTSSPQFAVIGSGPSGCYTAQFLLRQFPDAAITVFDGLTTPFGLVRYGVAPDHQGTKAVTRQFDRLFSSGQLRFAGNVTVGSGPQDTIDLPTIRNAFDAVILATGLWQDRELEIPGASLPGVYGSGQITRMVNAHPDYPSTEAMLHGRAVVIGQGNVAVDLARFLTKTQAQYAGSDLSSELLSSIRPEPLREIHLVGRAPLAQARFDPVMIKELGDQPQVRVVISPRDLDEAHMSIATAAATGEPLPSHMIKRVEALAELAAAHRTGATTAVHLHFGVRPLAFKGRERVTGVTVATLDGDPRTIATDCVVTAIGFAHEAPGAACVSETEESSPESAQSDLTAGRVASGLYCVGWLRRGPRGTIPENRKDAQLVAQTITDDIAQGALPLTKPGYPAIAALLEGSAVSFAGWQRVNEIELDRAAPDRARHKIQDRAELLHHALANA